MLTCLWVALLKVILKNMKMQIVIFDGFDELDAIAPFEILKNAAAVGADLQVELMTVDDAEEVTAGHGLRIRPTASFTRDAKVDVLIVPGGNWGNRTAQGTWAEVQKGKIPEVISHLHQSGTLIAGVCTGAMLIAAGGLLKGRPAITHHQAIEDLRGTGAEIVQARVVDDGDIITAGGVTSGFDLTLWLVERCFDAQIAQKLEVMMEYERRGTVWRHTK